jgi:pimeloyl-ACP methyl ester carboxylesterase
VKAIAFIIFTLYSLSSLSQEKVSFYSADSLKITADLYLNDYQSPFILLFPQDESSRGEYKTIAPRLQKLGYNCLAVDLRCGDKMNYVQDETAQRARESNLPSRNIDALKDMEAAIKYIRKFNHQSIILFGSSFSASLALIMAKDNKEIKAVVAFSPGEYFRPEISVKDSINGLKIPVFIASTDLEYKYVNEMLSGVDSKYKTFYKSNAGRGVHGAKALWPENQDNNECWLQLTYFFGHLTGI